MRRLAWILVCVLLPRVVLAEQWFAGDLHTHVSPPDALPIDVKKIADGAAAGGLAFVILTPHLWGGTWEDGAARKRWIGQYAKLVRQASAEARVTLIPGVELARKGVGHFGLSGVDFTRLGDDFLASALAAGAFVVVNHPFAVPSNIPGLKASREDVSYRRWSSGNGPAIDFHGVEIWNSRLALINLVKRSRSGEELALEHADRTVRSERRKLALVAGTDTHAAAPTATTWVRAADRSAAAILAGLRAGATCVGGKDATTFRARGDGEAWVGIGGTVRATKTVQLRWDGSGRVFVDGEDRGIHQGTLDVPADAKPHTYRVVVGPSRSGFIYANVD